jgi:hypothetical protein
MQPKPVSIIRVHEFFPFLAQQISPARPHS